MTAYHVGDLIPSRAGLEMFKPSESGSDPAHWMGDARTGQIIWSAPACDCDNGRGVAADIWSGSHGGGDTRLLTGSGVASNNGTKANPALQADILGDWREEVIWRTSDNRALRIYSTTDPTSISRPSLMQDRQYRVAVAWQNTAYNQPPHPGFAIS